MIEDKIKRYLIRFDQWQSDWQYGELTKRPIPDFSLTEWVNTGRGIEDYPGINEPNEMMENNECNC